MEVLGDLGQACFIYLIYNKYIIHNKYNKTYYIHYYIIYPLGILSVLFCKMGPNTQLLVSL